MNSKIILSLFLIVTSYSSFSQTAIDEIIQAEYDAGHFNGTVLVEKNNEVVLHTSKGYANFQFSVAVNNTTRFPIASMTKTFTSILVLQLQEKYQLRLDDKITKYIDSLPVNCQDITVLDLLTHYTGLKNEPVQAYLSKYSSRDFIKKYIAKNDTVRQAGFNYNNVDYIILTRIIETISGKTYETVLQENILNILSMTNTGLIKENKVITNLAYGYHNYSFGTGKKEAPVYNDPLIYLSNYAGAGAIYSTAEDLLKLIHGLREHKLLSAKTISDYLVKPQKSHFLDFGKGYPTIGFYLDNKTFLSPALDRNGSINGFNTRLITDETFSKVVIILANTDTGDLEKTGNKLYSSIN